MHAVVHLRACILSFACLSCNVDYNNGGWDRVSQCSFFFCASQATGQLYRLPRQPEAKLASSGAENAAAASRTEISQEGSLKPGTDSKDSKPDLGQCSIQ